MTVTVVLYRFSSGSSTFLLREGVGCFPVLPNERSPTWRVFFYSGDQLDTHVDTHTYRIHTHTRGILSPVHVEKRRPPTV